MKTRYPIPQWRLISHPKQPCRYTSTTATPPPSPDISIPDKPTEVPDTRTHRRRINGNRPLPLPPIMDPHRIAQRAQHKQPKSPAPTPAQQTPFQKALHRNPYAHLLNTAIRNDRITQATLPSALLLPLDIKDSPHPPHSPYYVPSTLYSSADPSAPQNPNIQGPKTYVPLSYACMRWLGEKSKRIRGIANPAMWKMYGESYLQRVGWRADMQEVVLGLLRRGVERKLKWVLVRAGSSMVERIDEGPRGMEGMEGVACVVYVGRLKSEEFVEVEKQVAERFTQGERIATALNGLVVRLRAHVSPQRRRKLDLLVDDRTFPPRVNLAVIDPPAVFPMIKLNGKMVPVYSLDDLIGQEETEALIAGTRFKGAKCLAIKDTQLTASAQMWLLKLQTYLA